MKKITSKSNVLVCIITFKSYGTSSESEDNSDTEGVGGTCSSGGIGVVAAVV